MRQKFVLSRVWTVILWIMAAYYYFVISGFSAQLASESSQESGRIAEKLMNAAAAVFNLEKDCVSFDTVVFFIRKLAHFTNFFILGFLYTMLAYGIRGEECICLAVSVFICGFSGAVLDEAHQYFVPGRSCELRDAFIDFSGVYVGYFTFLIARMVLYGKKD